MSLSMSCSLSQTQSQTLSLATRHAIVQEQTISLRLSLIDALHGGNANYKPKAECPRCFHRLTSLEILKGFNTDPTDLTTGCPKCKHRFRAQLVWSTPGGKVELELYCPSQTQAQMRGLETLEPTEFARLHPSVYHSAITHFGFLRHAYEPMGITYSFDEIADAKKKITPFLGKIQDTVIAELSGLRVNTVRRLRKQLRIRAYSVHDEIESIEG